LEHLCLLFFELKSFLGLLLFSGDTFSLEHSLASICGFQDGLLLLDYSFIDNLLLDCHLHLSVQRLRITPKLVLFDSLASFALLEVTTILQLVLARLRIKHGNFADFDIGVRLFRWTGSHDYNL